MAKNLNIFPIMDLTDRTLSICWSIL